MCQNSFIKQYLAKQQELLRQRLEKEAQKEDEDDGKSLLERDVKQTNSVAFVHL